MKIWTCNRCEHEWAGRGRAGAEIRPLRCPKCGSPYWDQERQRPEGHGRRKVEDGEPGPFTIREQATGRPDAAVKKGVAEPAEMTVDREIAARFEQVMAENPEADEGTIRRQVGAAVKEERRRREAGSIAEELRVKLAGFGVKTGKEVFGE